MVLVSKRYICVIRKGKIYAVSYPGSRAVISLIFVSNKKENILTSRL